MTRTRRVYEKPRRWRCALCPEYGLDLDPAGALERHYFAEHHTPCPF